MISYYFPLPSYVDLNYIRCGSESINCALLGLDVKNILNPNHIISNLRQAPVDL